MWQSTFLKWSVLAILTLVDIGSTKISDASETSKICRSEVCKKTAQIFQSYMDPYTDPCKDFYKFACGKFLSKGIMPMDQHMIGPFTDAFTTQQDRLKALLDGPAPEDTDSAQSKAIQFYKTCKGSETTRKGQAANMAFLQQLLKEFLNGWPLTTRNWDSRGFDLTTTLAKVASQLDDSFFVAPNIIPDMADSAKYTITLMPQSPSSGTFPFVNNFMKTPDQWRLENITGLNTHLYGNYQLPNMVRIIREVACVLDPQCATNSYLNSDATALSNMLSMVGGYSLFQPEMYQADKWNLLKKKYEYAVADPEVESMRFTIARLNKWFPLINWQKYFAILFQNTDFRVDSNFKVLAFSEEISQLLDVFEQLNKRQQALFFGWHIVAKWGVLFSSRLRQLLAPSAGEQTDFCLQTVNEFMGYAVGELYSQKYLSKADFTEAETIVGDLKTSFRNLLEDNPWMDEATRAHALRKIDNMAGAVNAPDWTQDKEKLDKYYSQITSTDLSDFRLIFRKSRALQFAKQVNRLKRPVDRKNDWPMETPAMTNAFYFMPSNTMYFGSGMYQFPFYEYGRPKAVNFGSFGYVAGHEITHGFDTDGSSRNANGEIENWWTPLSENKFTSRAECFVRQYGSIRDSLTGMMLNGKSTIGENIADNGGIRAAFKAYKNVSKAEGSRLVGMEKYSEDQLFFMSAALTYCTKSSPEIMEMLIVSDEHSPNMYRAYIPMQNSEDFAKAFNCPVNSRMNPQRKCRVW